MTSTSSEMKRCLEVLPVHVHAGLAIKEEPNDVVMAVERSIV